MTKQKILVFYDEKEKNNILYFLNNIEYKQFDIDLIIENNIDIKKEIPKKVNLITYKKNKINQLFFKIKFQIINKNKYEQAILYSSDNVYLNKIARKKSTKTTIFINTNNIKQFEFRNYFIKRHIYEFNRIILKTNEEKKLFLKYYPTLTKKTCVINDIILNEEIEKLANDTIQEKIKKTDKTILLITELNEEKNKLLNILKLIKKVKNDIENIKLYILGDGIDKYAYETFIEDNKLENSIFLLGKKKNVYPYIKQCKYILLNEKKDLDKYLFPSIILNTQVISTYYYSDDVIKLGENYGYIISNDKKTNLKDILKSRKTPTKKIDFNKINKEKIARVILND